MGAHIALKAFGGASGPETSPPPPAGPDSTSSANAGFQPNALDMLIPGFSFFTAAVQRYLHVDLNVYIPLFVTLAAIVLGWQYLSDWFWSKMDSYLMSKCSLRTDDEAYNYVMAWVAKQQFSQKSRRFIVNTNTNSRNYFIWNWNDDQKEEEDESDPDMTRKPLAYTPDYGAHYFFYKRTLLCFLRSQGRENPYSLPSEKEEIYISCFGRNPAILKDLLNEARDVYLKRDEKKTAIYRGTVSKGASSEPTWSRCMARTSRPFSTVILNEKVKQDLIDDVTDYLDPATRRWYSNRGIPYRRGYLLHGPPGTGKSSLSLALAGFFKMRIYIVSLSSVNANEETLATLFAELPRRCVVLLEDIDSAGLSHTREGPGSAAVAPAPADADEMVPGQLTPGLPSAATNSRISLSGLLNILDGVASQEGRVLIMTTNHIEKLDKALIRPGRVDMIVHFGRADRAMIASIFKAIYAPLEGDEGPEAKKTSATLATIGKDDRDEAARAAAAEKEKLEATRRAEETLARIETLAAQFADRIPAHEFSPAELQGYLMKHKRDAEAAVAGAEEWVVAARKEKAEKEVEEAKERRRKEEEGKEEADKKKRKEERKKNKTKRAKKAAVASKQEDSGDSSGSDTAEPGDGGGRSDDSSDEEEEEEASSKMRGKSRGARRRRKAGKKAKVQEDEGEGSEDQEAARLSKTEEPKQQRELLPSVPAIKLGQNQDDAKPPRSPVGGDSGYETC
ncbi:hypothetical protein MCOR25_001996 [Pyricularia grisea]|uniref:Mitochondrial chaperone BCS1 n=1 Tax=Pyricularia grisea TaxID=148305 RepID=A0A6P8AWE5_PYRGI|nr:uncharacterized protein PgNI_08217 [Pyricularia grisea]KAI6379411.1 hypothetical protein MCOR25_001996 [Pyricularia grisea]TLD06556.1 hypothetical protein PgNI_08217 [Pyricularia grisea]